MTTKKEVNERLYICCLWGIGWLYDDGKVWGNCKNCMDTCCKRIRCILDDSAILCSAVQCSAVIVNTGRTGREFVSHIHGPVVRNMVFRIFQSGS